MSGESEGTARGDGRPRGIQGRAASVMEAPDGTQHLSLVACEHTGRADAALPACVSCRLWVHAHKHNTRPLGCATAGCRQPQHAAGAVSHMLGAVQDLVLTAVDCNAILSKTRHPTACGHLEVLQVAKLHGAPHRDAAAAVPRHDAPRVWGEARAVDRAARLVLRGCHEPGGEAGGGHVWVGLWR